jgi:phytoene/squalene synthetase
MSKPAISSLVFCRDLVRSVESRDNYLVGLLLPTPSYRRTWFATRALNVELAQVVSSIVSNRSKEPALARMVWWRESVMDVCIGKPAAAHPVLKELEQCVVGAKLARSFLVRMIDARAKEIERVGASVQFRSMAELEEFAEQVYASLA